MAGGEDKPSPLPYSASTWKISVHLTESSSIIYCFSELDACINEMNEAPMRIIEMYGSFIVLIHRLTALERVADNQEDDD
jgi:hypothetical protein